MTSRSCAVRRGSSIVGSLPTRRCRGRSTPLAADAEAALTAIDTARAAAQPTAPAGVAGGR